MSTGSVVPQQPQQNTTLSFIEELGITILMTILQRLHFDPTRASVLRNVLLPVRDTLNTLYPPNVVPPVL